MYHEQPVWSPCTQINIDKLEKVQRRAARFVCNDFSMYSCVTTCYPSLLPVLSGVSHGRDICCLWFTSMTYLSLHPLLMMQNSLNSLFFDLVDSLKLQENLNSLVVWCHDYLAFNTNKFKHLSFNNKFLITYKIDDSPIMSNQTHREFYPLRKIITTTKLIKPSDFSEEPSAVLLTLQPTELFTLH